MEKQISKTKIEKRMRTKSDVNLVSAIIKLKRTNPIIAKALSKPKRKWSSINLKELTHIEGDVLVTGKVLSAGELDSKKKIVAWNVSEKALEKINDANCEFVYLADEILKNPELNGLTLVN
jgi:large subunit ribosomal protein L18e